MTTHDILLTVQYISISVLFTEILIVFMRWNNSIHSYLFLTCITSFISNIGYLMAMKSATEEAYLTAVKLSYVGRVWIVFAFFLFSAKMCRVKLPPALVTFLVLMHTGIYIAILYIGSNNLYYKSYRFISDPVFPRLEHTNGVIHDLLMGSNVILSAFAMYWVLRAFHIERNRTAKYRLLMLIMAFGVQIFSFLLQIAHAFEITKYYDLTMLGALLGTIFMLIGIFEFDLLGTREIARDFVIDRISEAIIAVDNEGRIQYFNEPVSRLYPEFEVFFSPKMEPLKHLSDRRGTPYDIISRIDEAVTKGETINVGGRLYTPEKNDLVFKDTSYGVLYALVDDTEHYRYMEELRKQKEIADSANEAKSRFLANMSHEIRTPINAVLGMDEMILRESREKPIRNYAADIMSAGRTLLSLINDILDFSKVEEGKMEIIPVQYDLSSLINDLVNMTRDRAQKKGLKFNVEVDEHVPHLLVGDEIRIRQCVMNILTNAVKYTESGEVSMSISHEKKNPDHILLRFSVADTGIGMKAEDMDSLFSPYKRIEEKRNRSIEGTGLGMSITRQLLDLMGSSLHVESEYGKGSTFSFEVDQEVVRWDEIGNVADRLNDMSEHLQEYHELFHAPDARILVVDDTEMNLTVIQSLLKRTLIRIDTAGSGREAVEMAARTEYDAIFIDHMMPDMDGIETLQHIRESGRSKDSPVVALTANAISGAREMYLKAGFEDYLSKPVDGEKLEKMLLLELLPDDKIMDPNETTEDETGSGADKDCDSCRTEQDDSSTDLMANLAEIDDIDEQAGLKNCGSEEGYLSVLSVFHQTARTKADEIEELYRNGDMENYTIKVHALKSSARIIGAGELSEFAKALEDAGKSGDTEYIQSNTEQLLDMYRGLDSHLSWLDGDGEELPEIDAAALKEAYQTIDEIAGSMDYEMMDGLLKELHGYSLPEADRRRIADIEKLLTELDWDGILNKAREAIGGQPEE